MASYTASMGFSSDQSGEFVLLYLRPTHPWKGLGSGQTLASRPLSPDLYPQPLRQPFRRRHLRVCQASYQQGQESPVSSPQERVLQASSQVLALVLQALYLDQEQVSQASFLQLAQGCQASFLRLVYQGLKLVQVYQQAWPCY